MTYTITFKEVGRDRQCWQLSSVNAPSCQTLMRAIKSHHALASRGISFEPTLLVGQTNTETFSIFAGDRVVGKVDIQPALTPLGMRL